MPNSRSIPFEFPFRPWTPDASPSPPHTKCASKQRLDSLAHSKSIRCMHAAETHRTAHTHVHARLLCTENRTKRTLVCHRCYVRCIHTPPRKLYSQNLHSDSKCKYFNCLSFDFEQFVQCGTSHTHTCMHANDPTISISIHVCVGRGEPFAVTWLRRVAHNNCV